jgi:hypothetical protein
VGLSRSAMRHKWSHGKCVGIKHLLRQIEMPSVASHRHVARFDLCVSTFNRPRRWPWPN